MKNSIKLDTNGLKQLEGEISRQEAKRAALRERVRDESKLTSQDSSSYDEARQQLDTINRKLANLRKTREDAEVVGGHGQQGKIDIGDVVTVYNAELDDRFDLKLTANYEVDPNAEIDEASINSPVGAALFGKKKGDTVSYKIENREFTIRVEQVVKSNTHTKI